MTCISSGRSARTSSCSTSDARAPRVAPRTSVRTPWCRRSTSARRPASRWSATVQLEVHELEVRYGRVHAVRGVSATLAQGEIVAVLGAHGAGKSSLFRAGLGLARPCGGTVIFYRRAITPLPTRVRGRGGGLPGPQGRRLLM